MPIALPPNPFPGQTYPHQAYQKCVDLESRGPELQKTTPPGLVAARLLGYLLGYSENGRPILAREIIDASDDETLVGLAQHYITHFVKVCTSI